MARNFSEFFKLKKKPDDEYYMRLALVAAEKAKSEGDHPVGAVLVWPGGHMVEFNTTFSERDCTSHAEMNVIRKVLQTSRRRLDDTTLYCTVEPCVMCAAAAVLGGVKEIIWGAYDHKNGFHSTKALSENVTATLSVKGGIMGEECCRVLPATFQEHTFPNQYTSE